MAGNKSYLQFWGKAGGARDGEHATHPAAYHGLDVAASADALLQSHPRRLAHIAMLLGTTPANARRCLTALIALHDVGKFAEAFQQKVPEAWPTSVLGALKPIADRHHTVVALDLFDRLALAEKLAPAFAAAGWDDGLYRVWATIACHHGKPMQGADETFVVAGMRSPGINAATEFTTDAIQLFGPYEPVDNPDARRLAALTWVLAGLANLADWIGSQRHYFPYHEPTLPLSDYWALTCKQAHVAVAASGLSNVQPEPSPTFAALFRIDGEASPLQRWAGVTSLPQGPMLAVIEDVTGSGKTEAALLMGARLMADGRAGGIFFALPTMATANAMYDRLGESYRRMFASGEAPSLVLAHGRSGLHADFTASILTGASNAGDERLAEARGDTSSVVCAAWIADDRRKAFLAHIGVGTIDQAFLGVLPTKHQAMRLWGLADRILIVDEAHAYDAYMGRELERLLEFHAALGGSAIVLSATLPAQQRASLATAFARGLGIAPPVVAHTSYPLATVVSEAGATMSAIDTRNDRTRSLAVRTVPPGDTALSYVCKMAAHGAAVAWIRNSVDDAIEAADALRQAGHVPVLLHARFAMGDRLAIEQHVRQTLGKSGSAEERRGFVLVGTQILEQSLDYDVDAMITDLAPIDMIIQRAGRLWRHTERTTAGRPVATPELQVVAPDWREVQDQNWYGQVSPRAAAVYKHHGVIWRTAKMLAERKAIETPAGVRGLIEAVYAGADDHDEDVPEKLRRATHQAVGANQAQRAIANSNLLEVMRGYSGNNTLWTADTITPTRLGDPVTVFRLGWIEGGAVVPWCFADDRNPRRSWALSEVSLSQRKAVDVPPLDTVTGAMIATAKAAWPEWEREQPLLVLTGARDAATGAVLDKSGKVQPVIYGSRERGLYIDPTT